MKVYFDGVERRFHGVGDFGIGHVLNLAHDDDTAVRFVHGRQRFLQAVPKLASPDYLLGVGTAPAPETTAYARAVIVKVDVDGAQGGSIFWDDASLVTEVANEGRSWGQVKSLYR